jgi:hypothetical protein
MQSKGFFLNVVCILAEKIKKWSNNIIFRQSVFYKKTVIVCYNNFFYIFDVSRTGQKRFMMEEGKDKKEGIETTEKEEIYSKAVRAGKRTYFFDVKATRRNDYYLTITESKKRYHKDGRFFYEKHKIFLYKEDFEKFFEGLNDTIQFIKDNKPEIIADDILEGQEDSHAYTDVEFEDLEHVEASPANEKEDE